MSGFQWDANLDGAFTISDIWLLIKWLMCFPGNFLLNLMRAYAPGFAGFFEITADSQYGSIAWVLSVLAWVVLLFVAATLIDESNGKTP